MSTNVFINLPVKDLDKSIEFFTKLGFQFNPQFTDKNATCMIISDKCFVMLLVEDFFSTFTNKQIIDATKNIEVINSLSFESKEKVDEIAEKAIAAGAIIPKEADDKGFMYQRSFLDLDGHLWEVFYMDPSAINSQ